MPARPGASRSNVAVVIPVFRDTEQVRELLAALDDSAPVPHEAAVVSAEPDAELARLCRECGYRYLDAPRNRGAQLDLGARKVTAPVLWFVHADARVPPGAIAAIEDAIAAGAESGCFTFSFGGPRAWYKSLLAFLVTVRVRTGGIAYGDQALFVTRAAYEACGGFAHQPLFEEVRLVRRLRRRGTFRVLALRVAVSPRRWERDGWLRRTVHNRWLALRHALGVPAERLARDYGPYVARNAAHQAQKRKIDI